MRVSYISALIIQCTDDSIIIPPRYLPDTWGLRLAGNIMLAPNDNMTTQSSSKWK